MAAIDKSGIYQELEKVFEQAERGWKIGENIKIGVSIKEIIICCAANTRIAGEILKNYLSESKIPIFVANGFSLPAFASDETLVCVLSYAKDHDEIISMYRDAHKKRCRIITLSDDGKLAELSKINNTEIVKLENIADKDFSYAYLTFAILRILDMSGLIDPQIEYIRRTLKVLKHNNFSELTLELAEKLVGKIPLIYSSPDFNAAARRWKTNFNIISKTPAFCNIFPNVKYDEIPGFSGLNEGFYSFFIKSDNEDKNMREVISQSKDAIRKRGVPVTEMAISGDCYLTRLFSAILIGDWLSYNLAIKNGIDPAPLI